MHSLPNARRATHQRDLVWLDSESCQFNLHIALLAMRPTCLRATGHFTELLFGRRIAVIFRSQSLMNFPADPGLALDSRIPRGITGTATEIRDDEGSPQRFPEGHLDDKVV